MASKSSFPAKGQLKQEFWINSTLLCEKKYTSSINYLTNAFQSQSSKRVLFVGRSTSTSVFETALKMKNDYMTGRERWAYRFTTVYIRLDPYTAE